MESLYKLKFLFKNYLGGSNRSQSLGSQSEITIQLENFIEDLQKVEDKLNSSDEKKFGKEDVQSQEDQQTNEVPPAENKLEIFKELSNIIANIDKFTKFNKIKMLNKNEKKKLVDLKSFLDLIRDIILKEYLDLTNNQLTIENVRITTIEAERNSLQLNKIDEGKYIIFESYQDILFKMKKLIESVSIDSICTLVIFDSNGILGNRTDISTKDYKEGTALIYDSFQVGPYLERLMDYKINIGIWGGRSSPELVGELNQVLNGNTYYKKNFLGFIKGFETNKPESGTFMVEYNDENKETFKEYKMLVPKKFEDIPSIFKNYNDECFVIMVDDDYYKNLYNPMWANLKYPKYNNLIERNDGVVAARKDFNKQWKELVKNIITISEIPSYEGKVQYIINNELNFDKPEGKEILNIEELIDSENIDDLAKALALTIKVISNKNIESELEISKRVEQIFIERYRGKDSEEEKREIETKVRSLFRKRLTDIENANLNRILNIQQ